MNFLPFIPLNQTLFIQNSPNISCFSCQIPYSYRQTPPVNLQCGHSLCQFCFALFQKCPQHCSPSTPNPQSSPSNFPVKFCKIHNQSIQSFCVQDQAYLCLTCSQKTHQKHNIISLENPQPLANKSKGFVKAKQISPKGTPQLTNFLEEQRQASKRQISEIIDQRISSLELLKKKQHKEADIAMLTQQNRFEQELAQEQISQYYEAKALVVEAWRRKPEENLANEIVETSLDVTQDLANFDIWTSSLQIEALQQLQNDFSQDRKSLKAMKIPKNTLNELFAPAFPTQKTYPKAEKDYLISVLKEFGLETHEIIVTGFLEITSRDPQRSLISRFNSKSFNCSIQKLALKSIDLPFPSFVNLCKIIQNINTLKDLTLALQQKFTDQDLNSLSYLLLKQKKTLKNLSINMDITGVSDDGLRKFGLTLTKITSVLSLIVDHQGDQTVLSLQRLPFDDKKSLEKLSLKFNEKTNAIAECLAHFFACEKVTKNQALQTFKLVLGKDFESPNLLKSLSSFLHDQENLEEIEFESQCKTTAETPTLLAAILNMMMDSDSLRKIDLTLSAPCSYFFLLKTLDAVPRLEEFSLNLKCTKDSQESQVLQVITQQLPYSDNLKRLALKFHAAKFSHSILKDFLETQKLKALASLDIEFIDLLQLTPKEEQTVYQLIQQLPPCLPGKRVVRMSKMITSRVKESPLIVIDE